MSCIACIIQLSKQLQGSLSCLRTGPPVWAYEICILAHGGLSCLRQGGATDCMSMRVELVKFFHARGDRQQERAPHEPGEGRQKEGRSGFLRATPNRFPGKTYLHTQDSATSYLSELWHVCIEQMDNFFRAFLQKFQPIKLRSWALFSLLLFMRLTKNHQDQVSLVNQIWHIIPKRWIMTGKVNLYNLKLSLIWFSMYYNK